MTTAIARSTLEQEFEQATRHHKSQARRSWIKWKRSILDTALCYHKLAEHTDDPREKREHMAEFERLHSEVMRSLNSYKNS